MISQMSSLEKKVCAMWLISITGIAFAATYVISYTFPQSVAAWHLSTISSVPWPVAAIVLFSSALIGNKACDLVEEEVDIQKKSEKNIRKLREKCKIVH